jgi:hypothetical protein
LEDEAANALKTRVVVFLVARRRLPLFIQEERIAREDDIDML